MSLIRGIVRETSSYISSNELEKKLATDWNEFVNLVTS
jgi:hypothetical protein